MLGAFQRGLDIVEARRTANHVLELVGLAHVAQSEARRLSGGERQRLVVARALAAAPDLILADEPTAQLDSANAMGVIAAIVNQRLQQCTAVVATHDLAVAEVCDEVLDLRHSLDWSAS